VTQMAGFLELASQGFSTIQVESAIREKALSNLERWLSDDAFEDARPQLTYLIEKGNFNALFDAFFQQIPFGTGGRRGPVGFGTNRINSFTVSTSIEGHCEFLKRHSAAAGPLAVVIAYDVRVFRDLRGVYDPGRPNSLLGRTSRDFARTAAQVYAANGIRVWFPDPGSQSYVSTPELSFAIRHLGAQGGLNISASHNHPDDNGAKIYNHRGSQEIPPLDEEMARIVEAIQSARSMSWDEAVAAGRIRWIPPEVHESYISTNVAAGLDPAARSARVVFTPLHGTGWSSVGATLERAGFDVRCFPGQAEADGTFPNVPFRSPNPEVRESLGAATEFASQLGADVVLGADPDADRLGMVVPDARQGWTFLNGNQIGVLLADYMLSRQGEKKRRRPFAVTTVVTTSLFSRLAQARGVQTVGDLPIGFKYIAALLNDIEEKGRWGTRITAQLDDFVLGIEESHGYLVIPHIRDKDAAGAGLLLAELVSSLKSAGKSVLEHLDDIYRRFGYVRNHLVSTVMQGARGFLNIRRAQQSLRERPPPAVGTFTVRSFIDRWDESGPLGKILSETDRAARDLLSFELEGGARIILRPSGTEPKNKIYVEVSSEPLGETAPREALERQKDEIDRRAHRLAQDFCLEMLARIDVRLPRYALEISDLVALEHKQDFARAFLPELESRILRGDPARGAGEWVDQRLRPYGADARLLVRGAIHAYLREASPPAAVRERLQEIFGRGSN
jgi:phosphoglucomutase